MSRSTRGLIAAWAIWLGGVIPETGAADSIPLTLDPCPNTEVRNTYQLTISIGVGDPAVAPLYQEVRVMEEVDRFSHEGPWQVVTSWYGSILSSTNGAVPQRDAYLETLLGAPVQYLYDTAGVVHEIRGVAGVLGRLQTASPKDVPLGHEVATLEALTQHFRDRWEMWTGMVWGALAGRRVQPAVWWERAILRPVYNPPLGRLPLRTRWVASKARGRGTAQTVHVHYELTGDPYTVPDVALLETWLHRRVPGVGGAWRRATLTAQGDLLLNPTTLLFEEWTDHEQVMLQRTTNLATSQAGPEQVRILIELVGRRQS